MSPSGGATARGCRGDETGLGNPPRGVDVGGQGLEGALGRRVEGEDQAAAVGTDHGPPHGKAGGGGDLQLEEIARTLEADALEPGLGQGELHRAATQGHRDGRLQPAQPGGSLGGLLENRRGAGPFDHHLHGIRQAPQLDVEGAAGLGDVGQRGNGRSVCCGCHGGCGTSGKACPLLQNHETNRCRKNVPPLTFCHVPTHSESVEWYRRL